MSEELQVFHVGFVELPPKKECKGVVKTLSGTDLLRKPSDDVFLVDNIQEINEDDIYNTGELHKEMAQMVMLINDNINEVFPDMEDGYLIFFDVKIINNKYNLLGRAYRLI